MTGINLRVILCFHGLKGASLRALELAVITAGALGRVVIIGLDMIAGMGLTFIRDWLRAGIEAAKQKGLYSGR